MKIQLKRSSVLDGGAAKEPTSSQMEYGELAVNYSETDPAIFLKDAADNIIRISGVGNISDDGQVEVPSTVNPPPNPSDGNLWYNADDGRLYVYYNDGNSTQWVDASPDGWNIQEAIGGFVKKAGDNMTGDLTFDTDKITLAADGSITAAGNILVGNISASASSTGGYIYSTRYIDAANVGSAALNGQAADGDLASLSIIDRSSGSGVETVVIKPTGSAAFAGGNILLDSSGFVSAERRITYSGSERDFHVELNTSSPETYIRAFADGDGKDAFTVGRNGAGTFAGSITSGGPSIVGGTNKGSFIGNEGNSGFTSAPTSSAIRVWTQGTSAPTVDILGNGSAEIARGIWVAKDAKDGYLNVTQGVDAQAALSIIDNAGDSTAVIFGGGSARFAGNNYEIASDGQLTIKKAAPYTDASFRILDRNNANADAILMYGDGSASFAGGSVSVNTSSSLGRLQVNRTSTGKAFVINNNTNDTVTLLGDGSAEFAGNVVVSDDPLAVDAAGVSLDKSGTVVVGNASGSIFYGVNTSGGTSDITTTINADGSASFGSQDLTSNSGVGVKVNVIGDVSNVVAQSTSVATTFGDFFAAYRGEQNVFRVNTGGNVSFVGNLSVGGEQTGNSNLAITGNSITATTAGIGPANLTLNVGTELTNGGSAAFAGNITAQGAVQSYSSLFCKPPSINNYALDILKPDSTQASSITGDGRGYFAGAVTASNVTFNLEADDDTKYTTTADSEGNETRVYNGAVLDVKDRIQNVLARMDAIEANEITDDATDSALLTLIASLTARLDERDTAIAALTTRIETLES